MIRRARAGEWPPLDVGTRMIRAFAWLLKAKFTHGAMVIARNADGQLLLVQERLRERGSWGLPGGFMGVRETPGQAAARELREEAGLDVDDAELVPVAEYAQPWARHYDHVFTVTVDAASVYGGSSAEVARHDWFSFDALPVLTRATEYALRNWQPATGDGQARSPS